MEGREGDEYIRARLHADSHRHARAGPRVYSGQRGLPLPQRLDSSQIAQGQTGRDGLDLRRRIHHRRHIPLAVRRHESCEKGRRLCQHRLPPWTLRLLRASRTHRRAGRTLRQLWPARSDRRPRVGTAQYRAIRRRSSSCHHFRRIRGRNFRQHAGRLAAGQGPLPRRDLGKRRQLRSRSQRRAKAAKTWSRLPPPSKAAPLCFQSST